MPGLNVTFTENEMTEIRRAAEQEGTSLKTLAHDAVLTRVHRARVFNAAVQVSEISAELNRRLADR